MSVQLGHIVHVYIRRFQLYCICKRKALSGVCCNGLSIYLQGKRIESRNVSRWCYAYLTKVYMQQMREHHVKPKSLNKNYTTYHLPVARTIWSLHVQPLGWSMTLTWWRWSLWIICCRSVKLLWPSDTIWWHTCWSTLAQVPDGTNHYRTKFNHPVVRIYGIYPCVVSKRVLEWVPYIIPLHDIFNCLAFLPNGQWVRLFVWQGKIARDLLNIGACFPAP